MIEIIPAIIPKSLSDLQEKVSKVDGLVKRIQVDVLDKKYTEKLSWPYSNTFSDFIKFEEEAEGLPFWESIDYQFDLMVDQAEEEMMHYVKAGAASLIFHVESRSNIELAIDKAKLASIEVGLAIKPSTPLSVFLPHLGQIDFVQFMGNDRIGENGVSLDERVYEKISEFRELNSEMPVSVDIGVNMDTAKKLKECGATRLVAGSAIYGSDNPEESINLLLEI